MSLSQSFQQSSPISPISGRPRKSRFTFKHLAQLASSSSTCPLRVIAHIDLDAFYAQCEGVRLNLPEDQPLAVQVSLRLFITFAWANLCTAMARPDCYQLPGKKVWSEQAHHDLGSQEAMP